MEQKIENFWNKFWLDKHGKIVIWQTPNKFLIGWVVLTFISLLMTGTVSNIFLYVGLASIVVWCLLEIFRGSNYFRRILGVVVLVMVVLLAA